MASALWLLYLADVASGLAAVFGIGAGCLLVAAGFIYFFAVMEDEPPRAGSKPMLIIGAALAMAAALIPSQSTLYAIAAVKVGDTALHTPTGDKAMRALNAWLDRQIADDKK